MLHDEIKEGQVRQSVISCEKNEEKYINCRIIITLAKKESDGETYWEFDAFNNKGISYFEQQDNWICLEPGEIIGFLGDTHKIINGKLTKKLKKWKVNDELYRK